MTSSDNSQLNRQEAVAVPILTSPCLLSMLWSPGLRRSSCIGRRRNLCFEALLLLENVHPSAKSPLREDENGILWFGCGKAQHFIASLILQIINAVI